MALSTDTRNTPASAAFRWRRQDTVRTAGLMAVIAGLHVVAFGVLFLLVVPHHYAVGSQVFGVGLGITAYTLGMRHAFDADHIAAIDNTTRKLMADGKRPVSVGFWFALGHSSVVVALAALVAGGAQLAGTLLNDESRTHQILGIDRHHDLRDVPLPHRRPQPRRAGRDPGGSSAAMRDGHYDEAELEQRLDARGFMNRFLGRFTSSITRPGQMFPLGFLFGLGFDTATEVTLMVMAGSGAAAGLPWYAVLCLPLLFAAGMSLFDTLDGTFMNFAYQWAFSNPVRKVYYNLTITGLSIAVAFFIGTIELVTVLHDKLALNDPLTGWISGLDLDNVGFLIVGLFVVVWAAALAYWRLAGVEKRWAARTKPTPQAEQAGRRAPEAPQPQQPRTQPPPVSPPGRGCPVRWPNRPPRPSSDPAPSAPAPPPGRGAAAGPAGPGPASPPAGPATSPRTRCRPGPWRTATWRRGDRSTPPARPARRAVHVPRRVRRACRSPRPGGRARPARPRAPVRPAPTANSARSWSLSEPGARRNAARPGISVPTVEPEGVGVESDRPRHIADVEHRVVETSYGHEACSPFLPQRYDQGPLRPPHTALPRPPRPCPESPGRYPEGLRPEGRGPRVGHFRTSSTTPASTTPSTSATTP